MMYTNTYCTVLIALSLHLYIFLSLVRVQSILNEADSIRDNGTPYQHQLLDDALQREIASIWQTDEVSRVKPSPQSEAERGTLVLETVLWEVLPSFLRKLDATMKSLMGDEYGLPLTARPFIFSSWMGGELFFTTFCIFRVMMLSNYFLTFPNSTLFVKCSTSILDLYFLFKVIVMGTQMSLQTSHVRYAWQTVSRHPSYWNPMYVNSWD